MVAGIAPGQSAENGAGCETGAAWIIEVEEAANELSGREQSRYWLVVRIQDLALHVDT